MLRTNNEYCATQLREKVCTGCLETRITLDALQVIGWKWPTKIFVLARKESYSFLLRNKINMTLFLPTEQLPQTQGIKDWLTKSVIVLHL